MAAGLLTSSFPSWFPFEVVTLSCCSRAGLRGLSKLLAWLALPSGWEGMASASGFGVCVCVWGGLCFLLTHFRERTLRGGQCGAVGTT